MSIRRRILGTYLVLVIIILTYIAVSAYTREVRLNVQEDRTAILDLKNSWAEIQISVSDLVVNWEDRRAYHRLLQRRAEFEQRLSNVADRFSGRAFYPSELVDLFSNLNEVWDMADAHLKQIESAVESPEFELVEERLREQPGLQRLSTLWVELLEEDSFDSRQLAYGVEQLVGEVEFFPIYAGTVNSMFEVILESAGDTHARIMRAEQILQAIFFAVFIVACIAIALRFSHALSAPIIQLAARLRSFIGRTGAEPVRDEDDEVLMLSSTVEQLIRHYTQLSERAAYLASGEISNSHLHFPREGIVGRSLDEIACYLEELSKTSAWIRAGEYGTQIRERSEHDVLAHNFNVMSTVIHEKIATLRNMFEAVDEAVLLLDENEEVLETNSRFYRLFGLDPRSNESERAVLLTGVVSQLHETTGRVLSGETVTDHFVNLRNPLNQELPVRITARSLPEDVRAVRRVMYLIANESWRSRAKRERERLRAQATMAELKALRAQINPHFFFNTLNSISYLIETSPDDAIETIEKLSELFRYALVSTKRDRVRLNEELGHIGRYLDIERLRYGEMLRVEYDVDEELVACQIPPMLIQPLAENAIRYGSDESGRVDITIRGKRDGDIIHLEVADSGQSEIEPSELLRGPGTGLQNVNHRLKTLYGEQLQFRRRTPRGLAVEMRIPI